ncbi:hypothetical protein ABZ318_13030 [Streptomyces sp. NPDC006197]|uniref:effector-associated constant component EACC1 n=1 Tax=Streptomyces sp. NPDC006197 TaxID=3156685 RepID=UPI00339E8810
MEIRLRVVSAEHDESNELTQALHDWLVEDRAVARDARISRLRSEAGHVPGAMSGDALEWIQLLLGSGFSTAGLVYAHMAFRASLPRRRQSASVIIERGDTRITLTDASPEAAARLTELLASPQEAPGPVEGGDVGDAS